MILIQFPNKYRYLISYMPTDNNDIISFNDALNDTCNNSNIYIVDDIETHTIIIDETNYSECIDKNIILPYSLKIIYLYFYERFIEDINLRNSMIAYNIYHKILVIIDKTKYIMKYPIIFDPIETYIVCIFTEKSFIRIGDGQQLIARLLPNEKYKFKKEEVCEKLVNISKKIIINDYDYDENLMFICYNDIHYTGLSHFAPHHRDYWIKGQYHTKQIETCNKNKIYYSSHAFRLNSTYFSFNKLSVYNFLRKLWLDNDIIIINQDDISHKFSGAHTIISINYGPTSPLTDKILNYVLNNLNNILLDNQNIKYTIFVKGAILSSMIGDLYYKFHRVCDIGSFNVF